MVGAEAPAADEDVRGAGRGRRPIAVPVAAVAGGLAWTGIILARLFVGGTIGLADQGDARRLVCQLGVRVLKRYAANATQFVYPTYIPHHWYGEACGADGSGEPYRSSQLWLLSLAKHLTPVLGLPGALDLRALGVICAVVVGAAVALLVLVLPGSTTARLVIASLVGLAAADSAVAEYFVSAYSEPAALLGLLALCGTLLWFWRRPSWPPLVAVTLLATFVMAAKTQTIAVLPAVMLAVLWVPTGRAATRSRWATVRSRLPGLVTSTVLVALAVVLLLGAPKRFNQIDAYDEVFSEILFHSPNKQADLRSLGVSPNLASASGSNILGATSAATSMSYLQFRDHVTSAVIVRFYLTHPLRLFHVAGDGLGAVSHWRQDYLGTYLAGSHHPPGAMEDRVGVYEAVFHDAPALLLILFWFATLGVGWTAARNRRFTDAERGVGRLAVVLAVATFFEFWVVMIGEGRNDMYKQMIVTNYLASLCLPFLAASAWLYVKPALRNIRDATLGPYEGGEPVEGAEADTSW